MPRPSTFLAFPKSLDLPYGPYMATVDRAIDGDTVLVQLSLGWDEHPVRAIRLKDVRAPESHQIGGEELKAFVDTIAPFGTPCNVYSEKTPRSGDQKRTFTRYVGEVILEGNRDLTTLVNAEIKRLEEKYGPLNPGL